MAAGAKGTRFEDAKPFRDPAALRRWLERNHARAGELWVRLYRKGSGTPSVTWPELVDQLLCFGWIDGVRRTVDDESYAIRVTPRRRGSIWSAVNLKRVPELEAAGLMQPPGLDAYAQRDERRQKQYSFEREQVALAAELEKEFRRHRKAWAFFETQPPGYRKTAALYVMSAKKPETRQKRLQTLIEDSANGLRIGLLRR